MQFDLSRISSGDAGRWIRKLAKAHGGSGGALHPGAADPQLSAFYMLAIPDSGQAQKALATIRENRSVLAAYIKPAEELP